MMTRREYAASLGLAKVGVRGKLSHAAHEAIDKAREEGMTFSDDAREAPATPDPRDVRPRVRVVGGPSPVKTETVGPRAETPRILNRPVVRVETVAFVVEPGPNPWSSDLLIAFGTCDRCKASVNRCACEAGVKAPSYAKGSVSLSKPVV